MSLEEKPANQQVNNQSQVDRAASDTVSQRHPPLAFPVVGIGASAGGLKALERFFQHLPAASGMAFIIVQHLAPDYKSELVMLLQRHTAMTVAQISDGMPIQPNAVYVIPPNKVLTIEDGHLCLKQRHRQARQHGPIDIFFLSLAADQGDRAVAIVLSGTGSDGANGVKAIKEQSGITMAQTPEDAQYDGMPGSAIATNCIDLVGTAEELAGRLVGYREHVTHIQVPTAEETLSTDESTILSQILSLLRESVGYDFADYKHSTILRRLGRRMRINDIENMADYLHYLQENPEEHKALFRDFLISVTNFFRDPEVFRAVQDKVVKRLLTDKGQAESLRIWVPGCATGEEAYSLAILLREAAEAQQITPDIQIFATDIDREALAVAQRGFYTDAIVAEVANDRLMRYFTREAGGYQIKKAIREQILFANHNLISDPPFSRLDLISCRNLLIYLDRPLQEKVLGLFHYALRPHGYLLLGISESTDMATNLFTAIDKKQRIFQRQDGPVPPAHLLTTASRHRQPSVEGHRSPRQNQRVQVVESYQQWRLQRYAPPALLVDSNYNLIHIFGDAGRFLQMKEGPASLNILDGVLPIFRLNLRTALYDAFQNHERTTTPMQPLDLGGEHYRVRIQVGPVAQEGVPQELVEIVFEAYPVDVFTNTITEATDNKQHNALAERLEEELIRTKERLQTTVEEYESSNEELQASNEELQSMNEELQSTTEQLETSKEELQSVNEELIIVNQELKEKVDALHQANGDLQNLMAATEIATIFVDRELCIQRYTPRVEEIFHIMPVDQGRPLIHITHTLATESLIDDVQAVLNSLIPKEYEVSTSDGRWYMAHLLPYRTVDDKIDGVVLTFVEISTLKTAQETLARREAQQATIAKLGQLALEGLAPPKLLSTALTDLCRHLQVDYGDVWELPAKGQELVLVDTVSAPVRTASAAPEDTLATPPGHFPQGADSQAAYVLSAHTPTLLDDLASEKRFVPAPYLVERGLRGGINLTIPGVTEPYGLLGLYTRGSQKFPQEDIDFLLGVTHLLAEAIERKRSEEELQALQSNLETQVVARTAELERSNQELDRFAYVASHDLKAPLRAITNLATWTLEDAREFLPQASQDHLAKLLSRVARMQHLLEDLLLYSRADRFRHAPELIDCTMIVQEAIKLIEAPAEFAIIIDEEMPTFRAERIPLELTLRNLIGNAVKHHHRAEGTIKVTAKEQGDFIEFTISDDGPGIAQEYHDRIFGMFQTLRSRDEVEGSGLGLAIVKKTIESRGGIIAVKSQPGEGATFRFTWPKEEKGELYRGE